MKKEYRIVDYGETASLEPYDIVEDGFSPEPIFLDGGLPASRNVASVCCCGSRNSNFLWRLRGAWAFLMGRGCSG
jgi:hypothetical protein